MSANLQLAIFLSVIIMIDPIGTLILDAYDHYENHTKKTNVYDFASAINMTEIAVILVIGMSLSLPQNNLICIELVQMYIGFSILHRQILHRHLSYWNYF